jgi:hypothetical protein
MSGRRLLVYAVAVPVGLMILFGGAGYLLNHGHPAALDRGLFGGLLLGLLQSLIFSWTYDRRVAVIHLVVGLLAIWGLLAWNPVYRVYSARNPHDVRLELIDQKPN